VENGGLKRGFMKRIFFMILTVLTLASTVQGQVVYPHGIKASKDTETLQWNRYETLNFTILSIDDSQGKWLSQNIETSKSWCLSRWGFPDFKFTKECRIFCVSDQKMLKKLFGLEQPKVEIRKNISVMWLVLEHKSVSPYLSQVCFSEFESQNNAELGFWFKRGGSLLNSSSIEIRQYLANLSNVVKKNEPMYQSNRMFILTEEEYLAEDLKNQKIFDEQAVALCVMLRKEFGEAKLQGFLRISNRNDSQKTLRTVYGFSGFQHFDKQYIRFMSDLTNDVIGQKTPDSYLEIIPVKR
jgi:hypothetical protein